MLIKPWGFLESRRPSKAFPPDIFVSWRAAAWFSPAEGAVYGLRPPCGAFWGRFCISPHVDCHANTGTTGRRMHAFPIIRIGERQPVCAPFPEGGRGGPKGIQGGGIGVKKSPLKIASARQIRGCRASGVARDRLNYERSVRSSNPPRARHWIRQRGWANSAWRANHQSKRRQRRSDSHILDRAAPRDSMR
jgi:hypothetical protein